MLQSEFQDAISSVSYKLNNVRTTCDFLIKSESLKKVIAIILTLGNYMNGGNMMRGQADGFGLEILGKLKDVKSNVPGVTLLHYVVNAKLSQENEHNFDEPLALPVPEPADVEAASTIKFDDIAKELDRLDKELQSKWFYWYYAAKKFLTAVSNNVILLQKSSVELDLETSI